MLSPSHAVCGLALLWLLWLACSRVPLSRAVAPALPEAPGWKPSSLSRSVRKARRQRNGSLNAPEGQRSIPSSRGGRSHFLSPRGSCFTLFEDRGMAAHSARVLPQLVRVLQELPGFGAEPDLIALQGPSCVVSLLRPLVLRVEPPAALRQC
eukprot:RCo048975